MKPEISPCSAIGAFAESDAPSIVRVETTARSDSFKVTAIDGGTARIIVGYTGTTGSARDTIVVTATPRPVATVSLTPDSTDVFVGATTTLRAALLETAGDTIRQRVATFSSTDTTIATRLSDGSRYRSASWNDEDRRDARTASRTHRRYGPFFVR